MDTNTSIFRLSSLQDAVTIATIDRLGYLLKFWKQLSSTMNNKPRAPTTFYRVNDASSCAQYVLGSGIEARAVTDLEFTSQCPDVVDMVLDHLDWQSHERSPFISVYSKRSRADKEADRRVQSGCKDVVIWKIDTKKAPWTADYRNVTLFAYNAGFDIPEYAEHNSLYEWLFVNRIPEKMIVRTWSFE